MSALIQRLVYQDFKEEHVYEPINAAFSSCVGRMHCTMHKFGS